jgi:transposase InsO family protein
MSWDIKDHVARRHEFVTLAGAGGVKFAALCRRFGISRKTGYKWCARFAAGGLPALHDQLRQPGICPHQTPRRVERQVLALRRRHPSWGPRKLHRRLVDLGYTGLPAVSTFARVLCRYGCISPQVSQAHQPMQRFVRAAPNELWQMDFMGHFPLSGGERCHPLTVLDDHSRYLLGLGACGDEQGGTVQTRLLRIFARCGLPEAILCDNGAPWGASAGEYTTLGVWLLRLGIRVLHGRPHHPQTQGKDERFHRTLRADLLARGDWCDLDQTQRRFDAYRRLYNHDRPHEALGLDVPASRYQPSVRPLPARLPLATYEPGVAVRPVKSKGEITFHSRFYYVGRAFTGLPVALRPTASDGEYRVCYAAFTLGRIDLHALNDRPKGHYFLLLPP